jgi:hypothetical protein
LIKNGNVRFKESGWTGSGRTVARNTRVGNIGVIKILSISLESLLLIWLKSTLSENLIST